MYNFLIKCPNVNSVVYGNLMVESNPIACSLTLRHATENRYVKYPVHKIHGDMNQLF